MQIDLPNTKLKENIDPEDVQLKRRDSTIVKETFRIQPETNVQCSDQKNHMKLE